MNLQMVWPFYRDTFRSFSKQYLGWKWSHALHFKCSLYTADCAEPCMQQRHYQTRSHILITSFLMKRLVEWTTIVWFQREQGMNENSIWNLHRGKSEVKRLILKKIAFNQNLVVSVASIIKHFPEYLGQRLHFILHSPLKSNLAKPNRTLLLYIRE